MRGGMPLRFFFLCLLVLVGSASARTPWAASHLQGSPEPPKPYIAERILTQMAFKEVLELSIAPGAGRLFVVERAGCVWSVDPQREGSDKDLLIDLKALHPDLEYVYGLAFHPKWRENGQVFLTYA